MNIINGIKIEGNNVSIINNKVTVDGKVLGTIKNGKLVKEGESKELVIKSIIAETVTINNDEITINKIESTSIQADGHISAGDIKGNVVAGAHISCDNISGDVVAGAHVSCDNIGGNVKAGGHINCDTVKGDLHL